MMQEITFTIPGTPVPFARAGTNGKRRYTPEKQASFMTDVKHFAARAMQGAEPFGGPVEICIDARYIWPESWSNRKRSKPGSEWKTSRPDADNIGKLICDAINGIVFGDDAQVASDHVWKRYGERSETRVRVRRLA